MVLYQNVVLIQFGLGIVKLGVSQLVDYLSPGPLTIGSEIPGNVLWPTSADCEQNMLIYYGVANVVLVMFLVVGGVKTLFYHIIHHHQDHIRVHVYHVIAYLHVHQYQLHHQVVQVHSQRKQLV